MTKNNKKIRSLLKTDLDVSQPVGIVQRSEPTFLVNFREADLVHFSKTVINTVVHYLIIRRINKLISPFSHDVDILHVAEHQLTLGVIVRGFVAASFGLKQEKNQKRKKENTKTSQTRELTEIIVISQNKSKTRKKPILSTCEPLSNKTRSETRR